MCVKMSPRDQMVSFADSVRLTLIALLLLLSLRNCFLRVCLLTRFAVFLKLFLPLKTSAISGTANSNKSTDTLFAAGTTYLRKNRIAVLPITCASSASPPPRCRPIPL